MAAIPALLWVASQPLAGAATLAGVGGLYHGGRRAYRLVRCFYDCQRFTLDVGGTARITVTRIPDEAN